MTKTSKERQAAFKQRMRSAGFVQTAVWVHATDIKRLTVYVAKLRKAARLVI